jgi:3-hydroxyacyl-CoA dehydrogenase
MKLVEIIHAFETSDEAIKTLDVFCKKLKKDPVIVQDTTGFIVNRLLTPYMLSAIRLLEMGTGTIADIDHAMKSGAGHPMGPFELADYIGLDCGGSHDHEYLSRYASTSCVATAHADPSSATGLSGPQDQQGLL